MIQEKDITNTNERLSHLVSEETAGETASKLETDED